jgi:adenosylmethionine---8-amino-7-oxononanoate aminotransferase
MTTDENQHIWYPFYQAKVEGPPIKIERAQGIYLYDDQGKSYIDLNSSWWVNVHGHGRPEIIDAIQNQFNKIDHIIFSGFTHEPAALLAKRMVELLGAPFEKVFFSDNGSTATEVAIKMAIQYFSNKGQNRGKIVAIERAYHGDTFGAMSVGERGTFNAHFEPFFFDVEYLPFPDENNKTASIEKAKTLAKNGDVIAFIVEPMVQGWAGMRMYEAAVLDELTSIFQASGALVIFDEIMTGWGRLGTMFAMDQCQHKPDIVCVSKGLTGGVLPLGLTIATQQIFDAFDVPDKAKALLHGHSYTGNPLSCAAALASLDIFAQQETQDNIQRVAAKMSDFVVRLKASGKFFNPRSCGTILAVELFEENSYFAENRNKIYQHFIDKGILCRPLGTTVFFNPPYVISDEELEYCFERLVTFQNV